jgi:hypothetical protein
MQYLISIFDALQATMRYKASKEHLTECLIACRNLEFDNREKNETTQVATYDLKSRQKICFSLSLWNASRILHVRFTISLKEP